MPRVTVTVRVMASVFASAVNTRVATRAPAVKTIAGFCALCGSEVLTVTPTLVPVPVLAANV